MVHSDDKAEYALKLKSITDLGKYTAWLWTVCVCVCVNNFLQFTAHFMAVDQTQHLLLASLIDT